MVQCPERRWTHGARTLQGDGKARSGRKQVTSTKVEDNRFHKTEYPRAVIDHAPCSASSLSQHTRDPHGAVELVESVPIYLPPGVGTPVMNSPHPALLDSPRHPYRLGTLQAI